MAPKADVATERKQQIYQAALTCFNRKGFHLTTMDDIVAESGLSKGALYWYFSSKKELFVGLFEDLLQPLGEDWEAIAADPTLTATAKIRACLAALRAQFEAISAFFGVIVEGWAQTHFDKAVQQLVRAAYKPYLNVIGRILEEGIAEGTFRVDAVPATAAVILTMFDGLALAHGAGLIDQDPESLLAACERLILRGLGAES